ncbi:MAG: C2 domain-containing protein [archaeon]|nr:C2 domain-containing protein [archaeon]
MDIYLKDKKPEIEMREESASLKEEKANKGGKGEEEAEDKGDGRVKKDDMKKNPYENYNMEEKHEKDMMEKYDTGENKMTVAYKDSIEFDMRAKKREVRMKVEDKAVMEKMRRWKIKITNIYITALKQTMDPFLQFTIGGNFSVGVYKNKKGDTYKIPSGKRGYTDKTEVILNVAPPQEDEGIGGRMPFNKVFELEMRMSYSMINKMKLMVELWEYNSCWMNQIHSYFTIPLIEIVNGNSAISEVMTKREGGKKNRTPFAKLEFDCSFQEIWDFNLVFVNWKASSLINPKKKFDPNAKLPSTKVSIEMMGRMNTSISSVTTSEVTKNSATPLWTNFDNHIIYRGTISELENEDVKITVYDCSGLLNSVMSQKVVGLKGLVDFEKIKTEMILKDKETYENFTSTVQGCVTLDNKPKYKQIGSSIFLLSTRKYLVIKINRVEGIRPAETRGIVDSFISVEWCGMSQRTRTVKENNNPSFNELLFFQVPIQEEWLNNIDKYLLKINEEFATKNEVSFNLMIEGDDNTYDNFGIAYFYLSEIKGSQKMQEKYFADDLKVEKKYVTEKYTGKAKLVSAFSQSNSTYVHFEAWFLDNFPPQVNFGEKKKAKDRLDKVPSELQKYFPQNQDLIFSKEFKNKIHGTFLKYSNYPYKERMFFNVNPQDQYTNNHLLPYYLCPISIPEKKYSRKDLETNPNFFDCNLNTLDEICHFVRCFPFPQELKNDIWSSPDFMLKLRKGNVEEHAILMACLMLGLKYKPKIGKGYINLEDLNTQGNDELFKADKGKKEETSGEGTGTSPGTGGEGEPGKETSHLLETEREEEEESIKAKEEEPEEEDYPYANRVFVCQGKLKETKAPHAWVMTLSEDYRDVTFWDPRLFKKFELIGRVDDGEKLKNFLEGDYETYEAVEKNLKSKYKPDKKKKKKKKEKNNIKDPEAVNLIGEGEDSIVRYDEEEDEFMDQQNDAESLHKGKQVITKNMVDDLIYANKQTEEAKGFDFVNDDDAIDNQLGKDSEKNFFPVDIFKDANGEFVSDVLLPYGSIDLIFNQNNIFANCQYHEPDHIKYNIYEKSKWYPYFSLKDKIWRGKFDAFYSLSNFGPVYSPGLVDKMVQALIKEMRVGIAAARSVNNININ